LNEPIPENKKVRDFLNGITDPHCATIKLNVLSNNTYMNNFHEMINYVASAIDMTNKNTSTAARQISELNRSNISNGGRGGGRGQGRGGRGRGGRGRSRGRGGGRGRSDSSTTSSTRSYSAEEWQNLSYSQKQEVYCQRERLATARTVAALLTEQNQNQANDEVSTITTPTINNGQQQGQQPNARQAAQVTLENVSQSMTRRRTAGAYSTLSVRQVKASHMSKSNTLTVKFGRAELDSHADTCGLNSVARVLEYTGQIAEVSGFANSLRSIEDVPIVKAALAYDDSETDETTILIFNQALYFGEQLDEILINPNQLREYGHTVNDVPKHLGGTTHSIITEDKQMNIPLELRGIISYFPVQTPTDHELDKCPSIILTSEYEWNPY